MIDRTETLVCDGKNLVMRNFYAYPDGLSADGQRTNLIHGSFLELFRLIAKFQPARVVFTWDSKSTFRQAIFPGYKAKRRGTPLAPAVWENLEMQIKVFREGLSALSVIQVAVEGVEGDDLVALSVLEKRHQPCMIISTDRDFWQLVRSGVVSIYDPRTKSVLGASGFSRVTGFDSPDHHLAFKVLKGDPGDGVPPAVVRMGEAKAKVLARTLRLPDTTWLREMDRHTRLSFAPFDEAVEIAMARNFKLISLHAAIFAQRNLLASVRFDRPVSHWSRFLEFCKRYRLTMVMKAYGDVKNRV